MSTAAPSIYRVQTVASRPCVNPSEWPRLLRVYLLIHATWLVMYALLGKGFAYAGWPPFYVGEILAVLAFIAIVSSACSLRLVRTPLGILLSSFVAWELIRTLPFVE